MSDDEHLVSDDEYAVSDDEYFDRMLEEVQGDDVNAESKGNIRNKFLFLWYTLYLFMQSKGNTKNGLLLLRSDTVDETVQCAFCSAEARHYSDSCPVVITGDERFRTRRPCWYCKKIEGTIVEDLIPDDRGHHKALCPVPDKRSVVRERLTQVQREIDRMWPR
ncbi:unnamed protein product [Heligmosomoides polygyrus]|uniref:CCHC-type domain-containing protein n=1 Tax=Heligmosomoides polygyrus TaxID=6339 RepID=A0A183GP80_HELPZ|nr:unnamed protein product [Heligmosomoides polygyrus]